MFKGYIPTRGKRPTEKVRGRNEFYTLDSVKDLNEYGGVLEDGFIMVDIDDAEQANILDRILKKYDIKCNRLYTSRGIHFYFRNTLVTTNAIAKPTAIGIRADIKLGTKNAVVPLKIDGVEREIITVDEVSHEIEANAQALINISRKRLCHAASPETQAAWNKVKNEISKHDPILSSVMVKECIYRGFCPEFYSCGYEKTEAYQKALKEYRAGINGN